MERKTVKYILIAAAAIAAALMMFSACGDDSVNPSYTGGGNEYLDDVPSSLDYKGEQINIAHWSNSFVNKELTADGTQNDAVDAAAEERNASVESRLGVKLNFIAGDVAPEHYMPIVQDEILSGTADYDIIAGVQCQSGILCANGCYLDLRGTKYLDLSKSYWNNNYIKELNISPSRTYLVGGDISLTTIAWAATMLYNTEMYSDTFGSTEDFYNQIVDGNWTLDDFFEKCRGVYLDVNGNGEYDAEDRFGMGMMKTSSIIDMFCFSSGVKYSIRDENSFPVLDVANNKSIKFCSMFNEHLLSGNSGILWYSADTQPTVGMNSLFEATSMEAIQESSVDESAFGVIPYPKLDAGESEYHSWISDNTVVYSVPVTLPEERENMISAVLEVMAGETRRLCLPAYYETSMHDKYTRDEWARRMIDLIHDGTTADFVSVYSESLDSLGTIMRQLIGDGTSALQDNYDFIRDSSNAKLSELLRHYDENTIRKIVPVTTDPNATLDPDDTEGELVPDNQISVDWQVFGSKYRNSGVLATKDMTEYYSYTLNEKGGIQVRSPSNKLKGGYFPTAAIQSREKVPLENLSVSFRTDEGFYYNNIGYSASYSFVWTSEPITELPQYTDQIGTNGLREVVPAGCDAHALSVVFMGTAETSGATANLLYIIMHDGTDAAPEIDRRPGYRWTTYVDTDLSAGVTISVKKDDTLGYVVSVNGTEYREGKRGSETLPIDLTPLLGTDGGHICMGAESTGIDEYANFTWNTINGKPAGSFFD